MPDFKIGEIQSIKGFDKNGNVVIEFDDACLNNISVTSETVHAHGGLGNAIIDVNYNKMLEFSGQAKSCNVCITREEAFKSAVEDFSEPRPATNNTIVKPNQKDDYEIFDQNLGLVQALQNLGISAYEANGAFRKMADILNELGNKWNDLDKYQQASAINTLSPSIKPEQYIPVREEDLFILPVPDIVPDIKIDIDPFEKVSSLDDILNNLISQVEAYPY